MTNIVHPSHSPEDMIKSLEKQGRFFDESSQTLIIQHHELIQEYFHDLEKLLSTSTFQHFSPIHLIFDPHHGIQDLLNKKIKAV